MDTVAPDAPMPSAQTALIDAEAGRRDAIEQLWFREYTTKLLRFEENCHNLEVMLRVAAESIAAGGPNVPAPTDRETEERLALQEREDLFGRRAILLEEDELFDRLCIIARACAIAQLTCEAFRARVQQRYYHPWDLPIHTLLPLAPEVFDRLGKNRERHLPTFMHTDLRKAAPSYVKMLDEERTRDFEAVAQLCARREGTLQIAS